ncbi:MarR family winged helix-turn-helix transcriptional regulator [Sporosarcina sp. A2]|uniref:MarR family winged helix-turn-helix transcriptional regulator n=1 Tax=Sporosarcina sp. A2 TaxID=3393449 RepID=UPI003D7B3A4C
MEDKDTQLAYTALDIIRVANILERLGGKYALEADLDSVQQYMILSLLNAEPNLSMGDLQQNTLVTKQAITGVVDRLKKGGYLETYKDSKDRRITRVLLTEKGKKALQATIPKRISGNQEAFSILSEEEISQLSGIFSKLILHLKNI